jgi:hypothetical protein
MTEAVSKFAIFELPLLENKKADIEERCRPMPLRHIGTIVIWEGNYSPDI